MPSDQPGPEGKEVPFGAGGFQNLLGVDAETFEDQGQFVDQRDVEVALRVFDNLGGLGHADGTGLVGPRRNNAGI